jgi:hypothetical protein
MPPPVIDGDSMIMPGIISLVRMRCPSTKLFTDLNLAERKKLQDGFKTQGAILLFPA